VRDEIADAGVDKALPEDGPNAARASSIGGEKHLHAEEEERDEL
jgi:hypothetical protein